LQFPVGVDSLPQSRLDRIEIDEKKLCEMKDKLLQKELTVARLNPSNDEVLKHFLNSFIDGHVLMEQPI
jgi:hypothetical protein